MSHIRVLKHKRDRMIKLKNRMRNHNIHLSVLWTLVYANVISKEETKELFNMLTVINFNELFLVNQYKHGWSSLFTIYF